MVIARLVRLDAENLNASAGFLFYFNSRAYNASVVERQYIVFVNIIRQIRKNVSCNLPVAVNEQFRPVALFQRIFGDSFVGPGFIDLHIHGAVGEGFNKCDEAGLRKILDYCACHGTTACLAGIMTDTVEATGKAVENISGYMKSSRNEDGTTAGLLGVYLEGPFLNPNVCGAMAPSLIIPADIGLFKQWEDSGVVRLITIAPEMPGARGLMEYVRSKGGCILSAGHTGAGYDEMLEAIGHGIGHITHFYNAMAGFHHRQPGAAAAGIFSDAVLELITDNVHVHPAMCKLVYMLKKRDQVCLITDSISTGGLPDGEYDVDGRTIYVKGGRNAFADGVLAGSSHTMDQAVKNTAGIVPVQDAWSMASYSPAKVLGLQHERGALKTENIADIAVLGSDLSPRATFIRGKMAWRV